MNRPNASLKIHESEFDHVNIAILTQILIHPSSFFEEPCLEKRPNRAVVLGIAPGDELVQHQRTKRIIADKPNARRRIPASPAGFVSNDDANFREPVWTVDTPELNIADMAT